MNFNVTRIRPKGFLHSSAFDDVIDSLAWSLSALGHQVNVSENWIDATDTNIIFGAEHLSANQPQAIPRNTIIYNLEQPSHPAFPRVQGIARGSQCTVWDYSLSNIKRWRDAGIYARHVPIGYTPNLRRIPSTPDMDIDVLFFGWMTPRRKKIIDELRAEGLNVVASDKCYGGGRDNLISRAKVCLNIHHDGRDMFEIVRCSFLMANYKLVITEVSSDDAEYSDLSPGLVRCDYRDLVDTTRHSLERIKKSGHGWNAHECIQWRDYTKTVESALKEPTPQEKVRRRYEAACEGGDMKDFAPWLKEHAKGTILEIGVRDGASTAAFLTGLETNGGVLLSVDTDDCGSLFSGHPLWSFIRTSSQNPKLRVPELDILLIDGDHTREGFRADLERFFPHVKPGGMILCHDVDTPEELTAEATGQTDRPSKYMKWEFVNFVHKHSLRYDVLPGLTGMGIIYKPDVFDSDESWEASKALNRYDDYEDEMDCGPRPIPIHSPSSKDIFDVEKDTLRSAIYK